MQHITARWVFGYGSLIWRPGFPHVRTEVATISGVHRRLCVYSFRHRGSEAHPGLVLGLMRGGSAAGMAFEVEAALWPEVHAYLTEREMDRGVYREVLRPVRLADGRQVEALAFLVDERHPQFAGRLALAEQARIVSGAVGESGANPDHQRQGGGGGGGGGGRINPVGTIERQPQPRPAFGVHHHIAGGTGPERHRTEREEVKLLVSERETLEFFGQQRIKAPGAAAPVDRVAMGLFQQVASKHRGR